MVVHDAAPIILSSSDISLWFTPYTIFFKSPLVGAVRRTLEIPFAFKCLESPSLSLEIPVLSIRIAFLILNFE